jgi:hypothetical protein
MDELNRSPLERVALTIEARFMLRHAVFEVVRHSNVERAIRAAEHVHQVAFHLALLRGGRSSTTLRQAQGDIGQAQDDSMRTNLREPTESTAGWVALHV